MVRPKARVVVNPVRRSRNDHTLAKNVTVGTVRERHLWALLASGRRKPFCRWCGATVQQATGVRCVELQQAVKQARIAATYGVWEQEKLLRAKEAKVAARAVERVAELARHEAKNGR